MSNFEAGKLYEAVIEEVIADSRQDFEDTGIDESTLQDLKKLWCEKLSQSRVGNFSWNDVDELDSGIHSSLIPNAVKDEPLSSHQGLDMPHISQYDPAQTNSTNELAGHTGSSYTMGIELPTVKQEYTEENGLILPKVNQSDGPIEFSMDANSTTMKWIKEVSKRQSDGGAQDFGGLGEEDDEDDENDNGDADGAVFNDSDDINSDLDDELDSEKSDDDDTEQEGQIMLCLYDKVQRVKNKWKCNLKEGVANIDGKDFVFQRATGESEW
ncbi:hypothetical protein FT663_05211 [Candidozyma haemuli var. vulneris]|uniref:Transcription initiation factor IIA large subunit n=1 Tax=Candidozyma haemuli TaxID=45357 RepID=A0A2V1B0W7_9ASCO|nr:hypothetical protein CXQ85_003067 [[Candida] haemuloni]KAF3985663.1 hypothetical protein FT663_05211 [[Candida] haemuloni var. vulneris]KAF3987180.1 hypothetical protein FT662_04133 [[Candida] haemuloni var. vulneris]PVH23333.1 hypothetical protein CXQ85_003067 [[Candida] haemuloni]